MSTSLTIAVPASDVPETTPVSATTACTTHIRPPRGWQALNLRELWQYRELLYFLAWRDVKVRYKQTVLGAAWAILQPLLMMMVFSIFFGRLAGADSGGIPYPLFAFAGLLPWIFFATAITNAGNSVVGSERLITKVYFPRLAIPLASVGAALVDFLVAFGMLLVLMVWYRISPTWNLLLLPGIVALFTLAAMGVGAMLAALNVAYRDFRYVIPFLVQFWMFATPSVYMHAGLAQRERVQVSDRVQDSGRVQGSGFRVQQDSEFGIRDSGRTTSPSPQSLAPGPQSPARNPASPAPSLRKVLLTLNPLTGLVASFRAAALGVPVPWTALGTSAAGALLAFAVGCSYFRRVEDSFADII